MLYRFDPLQIIDDHYHFHHNHVQRRSIRPSDEHHGRLTGDRRVHWALQQRAKSRQKRDFMRQRPSRTSLAAEMRMPLNDPKWSQMWYLVSGVNLELIENANVECDFVRQNRGNGLDMNVIPAWRDGITGKGVVVTILDDGLESDHPDLEQNYVRICILLDIIWKVLTRSTVTGSKSVVRCEQSRRRPDAALRHDRFESTRHALRRRSGRHRQQFTVRCRNCVRSERGRRSHAGRRRHRCGGGTLAVAESAAHRHLLGVLGSG